MKTIQIKVPSIEDCWFKIEASQDDTPVRGNAIVSGDDEYDAQVENDIINRLESGEVWAWALVKVTCGFDDWSITGEDYLGGCCNESEKDFVENSGYFEDMRQQAYDDFVTQIERMGNNKQ